MILSRTEIPDIFTHHRSCGRHLQTQFLSITISRLVSRGISVFSVLTEKHDTVHFLMFQCLDLMMYLVFFVIKYILFYRIKTLLPRRGLQASPDDRGGL